MTEQGMFVCRDGGTIPYSFETLKWDRTILSIVKYVDVEYSITGDEGVVTVTLRGGEYWFVRNARSRLDEIAGFFRNELKCDVNEEIDVMQERVHHMMFARYLVERGVYSEGMNT